MDFFCLVISTHHIIIDSNEYFFIMDHMIAEIISQFGTLGVVLIALGWLIYSDYKSRKDNKKESNTNNSNNEKIITELKKQQERSDLLKTYIDEKIDSLKEIVHTQPSRILQNIVDKEAQDKKEHSQQFLEQIKLAPKIHSLLGKYKTLINCDHIFLASFHNGTSSITGIPYYKYDMVAERYTPEIDEDTEMASMYQNVDLMRHGRLPSALLQSGSLLFKVEEDGSSDMEDIDPMMYRRVMGRGIKQIGFCMIHDQIGNPSGFLCILKWDYKKINMDELKNCASLLEQLYVSTIRK